MSGGLRPPVLKFSFHVGDVWFCGFYPALPLNRGLWPGGVMSGRCLCVCVCVCVCVHYDSVYTLLTHICTAIGVINVYNTRQDPRRRHAAVLMMERRNGAFVCDVLRTGLHTWHYLYGLMLVDTTAKGVARQSLQLCGSVVERRSLNGELSLTCSWWVTIYMGKPSAVGHITRPTQPFILLGSKLHQMAAITRYWWTVKRNVSLKSRVDFNLTRFAVRL